jgi:hypothetical protein
MSLIYSLEFAVVRVFLLWCKLRCPTPSWTQAFQKSDVEYLTVYYCYFYQSILRQVGWHWIKFSCPNVYSSLFMTFSWTFSTVNSYYKIMIKKAVFHNLYWSIFDQGIFQITFQKTFQHMQTLFQRRVVGKKYITIVDKKCIDAKHQRASKQEMQQVKMN